MKNLYARLLAALTLPNGDYGLSSSTPMTVMGGLDDNRVMPPTYLGAGKDDPARYHIEKRYRKGEKIDIVVLDSVQSCANRMEKAALQAYHAGKFPVPHLTVHSRGENRTFSIFELPHRMFDASVRDSTVSPTSKTLFFDSPEGLPFKSTNPNVVRKALLRHNPMALIFGAWSSTLGLGSESYKHARAWKSEIIAKLSCQTLRSASRIDPLKISGLFIETPPEGHPELWKLASDQAGRKKGKAAAVVADTETDDDGTKKGKKPRITDVNHSNIPPTLKSGGVSVESIDAKALLSFPALMQYTSGEGPEKHEEDSLVRAYLAAAALYMYLLRCQDMYIRSGCDIRPVDNNVYFTWENKDAETFSLTVPQAYELYQIAIKPLVARKLFDTTAVIQLTLGENVDEAVKKSRNKAE